VRRVLAGRELALELLTEVAQRHTERLTEPAHRRSGLLAELRVPDGVAELGERGVEGVEPAADTVAAGRGRILRSSRRLAGLIEAAAHLLAEVAEACRDVVPCGFA
jgi:hypothetical protein